MEIFTLILIAIGLSFDTFAVSVSTGLLVNDIRFRQAVRVSLILAFFQAMMPFAGWITGKQVEQLLRDYDHWFAFALLTILGLKMIYESFRENHGRNSNGILKLGVLIWMAIGTSIDALIVGVSFALIDVNIYQAMAIIGAVTFLTAMLGMLFGKKVGGRFGRRMEILGGIILIAIGIKILLNHLGQS